MLTAKAYQSVAECVRENIVNFVDIDEDKPPVESRAQRLVRIGLRALGDPVLYERNLLVRRWTEWWYSFNPRVPYDTRLNSDLFLDYAASRLEKRIEDSDEILKFEAKLDEDFYIISDYHMGAGYRGKMTRI